MSKWTWSDVCKINIDHLRQITEYYLNSPFKNKDTSLIIGEHENYEEKLAWFSEVKNKDIIDQFFLVMDHSKIEYTEIGNMPTAVDWVTDQIKNWEVVDNDMLYELCMDYLTEKGVIK